MWLSALIALLTYLLSPRNTTKERQQALINAGLAGGATYLATEYTDWGKEASNTFDSAIGVSKKTPLQPATSTIADDGSVRGESGDAITQAFAGPVGAPNKTPAKGGSLWDTIAGWGPATMAMVGGATGLAVGSGNGSSILVWGALALGAFLLLK